jgi:hypothetical protein
MERNPDHQTFWALADDLIAEGLVEEGTMMGHHCLRSTAGGGFVATVERSSDDLVVKLPRARVEELIEAGIGAPFAPAGKVFREWVAVGSEHLDRWEGLIGESIDFVSDH